VLLATITCPADQSVAERMRQICETAQLPAIVTEHAVDEAVAAYQRDGSRDEALNAGLAFISAVRKSLAERSPCHRTDDPVQIIGGRWHLLAGVLLLVAVIGLIVVRVAGLAP
jgi:hypothetical protein